jgi:hypothetical protein
MMPEVFEQSNTAVWKYMANGKIFNVKDTLSTTLERAFKNGLP